MFLPFAPGFHRYTAERAVGIVCVGTGLDVVATVGLLRGFRLQRFLFVAVLVSRG